MSHVTIFEIDQRSPLSQNVFNNFLAANNVSYVTGVGSYEGQVNVCYIIDSENFDRVVRDTIFVRGQESFLHVSRCNKMYAWLEFQGQKEQQPIGCMHSVCREEIDTEGHVAWTYRPDLNAYWVAKDGNPDGSFARSVAAYR